MRIDRSFIQVPGIGETREQRLWEAGVTTWRGGVEPEPLGPKTGERLLEFVDIAEAELDAENVDFFAESLPSRERWRLLESFRPRATALDIETTGLDHARDAVTTVTLHDAGGTRTFVRHNDLTRERLRAAFDGIDLLLTFNGSQFDLPFLERSFDLSIDVPHVDLRFPCRRAGLTGGLKRIEQAVGIERECPAVDGREAIRLWHQYRRGEGAALDRLIEYNRADTRSLFPVADRLVEALDREFVQPYLAAE